ncbi:glycosyltransferase family 2 protein [Gorillibacterium timonense]|uniref:glycosyltransferase family 2 protein n=1 Tax=Gorillibacterium timonense TaxID=1689269 RepID=UPI00071E0BE5|nr:glycosyltransferase family 2 protein [Gorillibacterium timonense]
MKLAIIQTRTDAGYGTEREASRLGGFSRVERLKQGTTGNTLRTLQTLIAQDDEPLLLVYAGTRFSHSGSVASPSLLVQRDDLEALTPFEAVLLDQIPLPEWIIPVLSTLLRERGNAMDSKAGISRPVLDRKPTVSVVLCTYNDSRRLPWAVYSVLQQSVPDWELLIVDDGSEEELLPSSSLLPVDPRVRLIRLAPNRGKAHALNAVLPLAAGAWFLELDADDWLPPLTLEKLLEAAGECESGTGNTPEPSPQAILAGHRVWRETSRGELLYERESHPTSLVDKGWRNLMQRAEVIAPRMYRTEALHRLGGWLTDDPSGGRLFEDVQLLARLLHANAPLTAISLPLYDRRLRSSSTSQRNKSRYPEWSNWLENLLS